jgi:hypothetical protein
MGNLKGKILRIEVCCPEYETTATIRINDAHSSGTGHVEVDCRFPSRLDRSGFVGPNFSTTPRPWKAELAGLGNSCLQLPVIQAVQVLEGRKEARQVTAHTIFT